MTYRIIQDYPGYYWAWDETFHKWNMMWSPVHRWYSPPRLHPNIMKYDVCVPDNLHNKIGLLIGHQGHNFIRITEQTGCYYIYYVSLTNKIEVWGPHANVIRATHKIRNRIHRLQNMTVSL